MASVCDVCGKKPQFGMRGGQLAPANETAWKPERPARPRHRGRQPKRIHVCTSCLKAGKVQSRSEEHPCRE